MKTLGTCGVALATLQLRDGGWVSRLKVGCCFLVAISLVLAINISLLHAQPLPEGWWLGGSPEIILSNAQARTSELSYFRGKIPTA